MLLFSLMVCLLCLAHCLAYMRCLIHFVEKIANLPPEDRTCSSSKYFQKTNCGFIPPTATDPGIKKVPSCSQEATIEWEKHMYRSCANREHRGKSGKVSHRSQFYILQSQILKNTMPRSNPYHFLHFQEEGETETLERKDYFRYIRIYSRFE